MFGGKDLATRFIEHRKGRPHALQAILEDVLATCADHRAWIKARQVMTIEDWLSGREKIEQERAVNLLEKY